MSDFLKTFSFDNLTFGEIAMVIVILFAILAFFRGVFKQLLGMLCLLCGAAIGFFVFKEHDSALSPVLGDSSPRTVLIASVMAGLVVYGILRLLMNLLVGTALFAALAGLLGKGGGVGFAGAIASIIPSSVMIWVTAMIARLTGAIGDFEQTQDFVRAGEGAAQKQAPWVARLGESIDSGALGKFFSTTDPIASTAHRNLAYALLLYEDQEAWARLAGDGRTFGIVKSPQIHGLLARDDIREMIANGQYDALLNSEVVAAASKNPSFHDLLEEIDFRPIVEDALFEPAPEDIPKARPVRRRGRLRN